MNESKSKSQSKSIGTAEPVGQDVKSQAVSPGEKPSEQSVVSETQETQIGKIVFYRRSKHEICPAIVVAVRKDKGVEKATLNYWCETMPNMQPQVKAVAHGFKVGEYCLNESTLRAAIAYEQIVAQV